MKRLQAVLSALVLFSLAAVLCGPSKADSVMGEALEASGVYLPLIARSPQDKWVLIKVTPDYYAFSDYISGHYTVVQTLGAVVADRTGNYDGAGHDRLAYHPPQNVSSYLLCRLREESSGLSKFSDVHRVPNGWEDDVLPAVRYLRAHPELSGWGTPDPILTRTRALLRDPNPCLVLTAVQQLAASRNLTAADLDTTLASTDPRVVAASLALVRFYRWADGDASADANARWLTERVSKIASLDQLQTFAVGLFAASPWNLMFMSAPTTDLPLLPQVKTSSRSKRSVLETQVIAAVRRRLNALAPQGGPADARWSTIDGICRAFKS